LTTAPTPADVGGFPRKNMRFETLPRNYNFKQQEQSRWTLYQPCTYILTHKGEKHNSRKPTQINTLEKIAVFGAGGKIHRHLGISNPTSRR